MSVGPDPKFSGDPQYALPSLRSRYRAFVFRLIEDLLRTWKPLANDIRTWKSQEGKDTDLDQPAVDMMPMIALSMIPVNNAIAGVDMTKINFAASVQTYIPGRCIDDVFAVWEAVEDAIAMDRVYRGAPLQSYLCSAISVLDPTGTPATRGIVNLRPLQPSYKVTRLEGEKNNPEYMVGEGSLVCFFYRNR